MIIVQSIIDKDLLEYNYGSDIHMIVSFNFS